MPFREGKLKIGMSLCAIQGKDNKVVGINIKIFISVRGAPREIANTFVNFGIFSAVMKLQGFSKFQKGG